MERQPKWVRVVGLWALLVSAVGGEVGPEAVVDSLYRAAVQVRAVSVREGIQAFKRVQEEAGWRHAPAYYEMAKLYFSLNTPEERLNAKRMIQEAIRLDPENVDYQLFLGDLTWQQGFWSNAMREYEDVAEAHPGNAVAAFKVGYHALKDFLKYKDMIDYERLGWFEVKFTWDHFAKEDRQKAISYLKQSIEADPGYRDAYYQLGFVYYESNQPEGLLRVSELLLKRYPNDKDALLFCGLGYQTTGNEQKAYAYYTAALKRMGPAERAVMESLDYIADEAERERIAQAEAQGGGAPPGPWGEHPERAAFWQKQDPLFLTRFNERRMAHYGRVAYANLAFSRPWKGIAGWETDKGKIHIRYGQPRGKVAQRPEMNVAHTETWAYEGFSVKFRNWDGLDNWGFVSSYDFKREYGTASLRESFRNLPPRYVDPYQGGKYSMPYLVAAFREADAVRVEVAYAIPKKMVGIRAAEGFVHLEQGVFLFDERWQEAQRKAGVAYEMADAGADSLKRRYLLAQHTMRAAPGTYFLAAEVRDLDTKSIGTFRAPQTFAFSDTALAMSDLLLAGRIEPLDAFPEGREDLEITPNPLRTYGRAEAVFVYLEVYNLTQDTFGRTEYEIAYRLGPPSKREIDPGLFAALDLTEAEGRVEVKRVRRRDASEIGWEEGMGGAGDEASADGEGYRVRYVLPERNRLSQEVRRQFEKGSGTETAVTARYEGYRVDDFTYLQIDVGRLLAGIYRLTVAVKDGHTGQTAEREVLFRVVE